MITLSRAPTDPYRALLLPIQSGEMEFQGITSVVSGSAGVDQEPHRAGVNTGATAGSTARAHWGNAMNFSRGKVDLVNFSKAMRWKVVFSLVDATPNGIFRLTLGKTSSAAGALAVKGIGIQLENVTLQGICHNGTALTTVTPLATLTAGVAVEVVLESNGAGAVRWHVDGALAGTSSGGGPTGDSGTGTLLQFEAENGADSAAQRVLINQISYAIRQ